jgi:hypothetical protein
MFDGKKNKCLIIRAIRFSASLGHFAYQLPDAVAEDSKNCHPNNYRQ